MSLIPVTLNNATDTYVSQTRSSENYADSVRLYVRGTSAIKYTYIYFPRPFPLNATLTSATLNLTGVADAGGSRTLTVALLTQGWKASHITYDGARPVDSTVTATLTKSAGPVNQLWSFDVTTLLQRVSDGQAWYGFRVASSLAVDQGFYSSEAAVNKPTLSVTWTDAPAAPSTLSPAGGRAVSVAKPVLRFDFTDYVGNTALGAVQVQANTTDDWTNPLYDSEAVATSVPQLDLNTSYAQSGNVTRVSGSTAITSAGLFDAADIGSSITGTGIPAGATITASSSTNSATLSAAATSSGTSTATWTETFPSMANGATMFWRVRTQDAAGVWSDWSLSTSWTRATKNTLTITNPSSGSSVVQEATPPITWTFTGQAAFQVIITDSAGNWLHNSGKVTSTATSYTLPAKVIHDGFTYTVTVRVWDTTAREATPGDTAYIAASQAFTYTQSATVSPVAGFTGTDLAPAPGVQFTFSRSTAPDSFTVVRDGQVIDAGLTPGALLVSGTTYQYTDSAAAPRTSHTWQVRAVVNGVTSSSNPTVTKTLAPWGVWLQDPSRSIGVQILNADVSSWTVGETADVYTPLNGTAVVRVTQSLRGFEGTVSGVLTDTSVSTLAAAKTNMYLLKSTPSQVYRLTLDDMSIPVVIGNVVVAPAAKIVQKNVSFNFWQVGENLW